MIVVSTGRAVGAGICIWVSTTRGTSHQHFAEFSVRRLIQNYRTAIKGMCRFLSFSSWTIITICLCVRCFCGSKHCAGIILLKWGETVSLVNFAIKFPEISHHTLQMLSHTHTHAFNGPFPGLPMWAGTRKVKPIWILLKQETVSSSGMSWAICKSAPHSRQITTPTPHHSVFYRPDALPAAQPTASKHWRRRTMTTECCHTTTTTTTV